MEHRAPRGGAVAVWSGVVVVALLIERWRYRAAGNADGADWQLTDERFIDPGSGEAMQVLYNPRTGERRYRAEPRGN